MRVLDFQHHFVPRELAERRGARGTRHDVPEGGMKKVTLHGKLYDPEEQLRDMEEAGLDLAILSCVIGWDAPLEDCRLINDTFAALQRRYPDRFVGLAHLPLLIDRRGAPAELDRAITELGLRGVTITSQVNGVPLDSPDLWDFYARAVELRIPIFVHPSMPPRGYEWIKEYDLSRIVGRELDLVLAVSRLIAPAWFDLFATDYPQDFTGATTDTGKGARDIRKYIEEIRNLPLPKETTARMLGGTAAELLGLTR